METQKYTLVLKGTHRTEHDAFFDFFGELIQFTEYYGADPSKKLRISTDIKSEGSLTHKGFEFVLKIPYSSTEELPWPPVSSS